MCEDHSAHAILLSMLVVEFDMHKNGELLSISKTPVEELVYRIGYFAAIRDVRNQFMEDKILSRTPCLDQTP